MNGGRARAPGAGARRRVPAPGQPRGPPGAALAGGAAAPGARLLLNPRGEAVAAAAGGRGRGRGAERGGEEPGPAAEPSRARARARAEPRHRPCALWLPGSPDRPEPERWQRGDPHAPEGAARTGRDSRRRRVHSSQWLESAPRPPGPCCPGQLPRAGSPGTPPSGAPGERRRGRGREQPRSQLGGKILTTRLSETSLSLLEARKTPILAWG